MKIRLSGYGMLNGTTYEGDNNKREFVQMYIYTLKFIGLK